MIPAVSVESDQFIAEILRDLQDEVYVYDAESLNLLYANDAACERCDWNADDLRGKRITDSSARFDETAFRDYVRPLLIGEKTVVRVDTVHEKGPVEITTRLSRSPQKRPVFMSVLRDRSERKRLETARMESFSEISHEMRTPLTSIKGSLHLLDSGVLGKIPEPAVEVLDLALRNTDRLLSIVNDILDLQKIQAGKQDETREAIDLARLVHDAVMANQGYGAQHDVSLEVGEIHAPAPVEAHTGQLMQVMANLLSNAVKYSPAYQSVTVALKPRKAHWRVTVTDRGPGIPETLQAKVFRSYAQVVARDGKARGGTGLGLAIARKLVRMHGGEIGFNCPDGEGTEFFFDLPKHQEPFPRAMLEPDRIRV